MCTHVLSFTVTIIFTSLKVTVSFHTHFTHFTVTSFHLTLECFLTHASVTSCVDPHSPHSQQPSTQPPVTVRTV